MLDDEFGRQNGDLQRWTLGLATQNGEVRLWTMDLATKMVTFDVGCWVWPPKMEAFNIG